MADSSFTNPLPGVPLVESPFFPASVDRMGLSDLERGIAERLHRHGYAVLDFPDPDLDARIERIIAHVTPMYGSELSDRAAGLKGGNPRLQDVWLAFEDIDGDVGPLLSHLYLRLNPDVALSGTDADYHYVVHGIAEGRRYKF